MLEEDHVAVCTGRRLPMSLLQVSKDVRNEVAPLFIGINKFASIIGTRSDLVFFKDSFGWTFQYIKNLHIDLRARDQRNLLIGVHRNEGVHRTIWRVWPEFCLTVRERMPLLRAFSLKCKVRCPEVAQRLLIYMRQFPRLQECAIHFCHLSMETIERMVKETCEYLTRRDDPKPFPFNRLPREIQLQILEYALADRSDPFAYNAGNSPSVGVPTARSVVNMQRRRYMRVLGDNPLVCCGTCSPLKTRCFCMARQTAYSTTCTCFTSPVPFFLVNKAFSQLATEVFFSNNIFLLIDDDPFTFLRITNDIPNAHLRHIHTLVLQFPRITRISSRPAHRPSATALHSWAILRRFIRDHFNLSRLCLYLLDLGTNVDEEVHTPFTRVQFMRALLREFGDLRGVYDFWVYLADDEDFEYEARRRVMGQRRVVPPRFIREYAAISNNRHWPTATYS